MNKFLHRLNDIVFGRGAGELLDESSSPLQIIGLTGFKQSGKSLVASFLQEQHDFVVIPFAKTLKEVLTKLYALSESQLYGDEKEIVDDRYNVTPRFIMERFATEVAREVHPETWVMAWERLLELEQSYGNARFVVDDVRFPNEVSAIRKLGGRVWRVGRPQPAIINPHISEQVLPITILAGEIINDSTLEELRITVEAWLAANYSL